MPDAFFASSSNSRKRKRKPSDNLPIKKKKQKDVVKPAKSKSKSNEVLSSDEEEGWGGIEDMDLRPQVNDDDITSGDEDVDETPAEKRLRLAQLYLDSVKESLADGEYDAAEIDKELISSRLKQDVLSHSGKIHLFIADSFSHYSTTSSPSSYTPPPTLRTRGHRFSITSAIASPCAKYLFTSGKEGNIIKWDLISGKKLATLHKKKKKPSGLSSNSKGKAKAQPHQEQEREREEEGHTDEVLALALSSDGKYLASGGRDRRLFVWDVDSLTLIKCFSGPLNHKDVISALSFRLNSHHLYTASFDRTLKLYDLTPTIMGYVETLFGHQDPILSISSLKGENCVSVGGRDKTARYWKIVDETQLIFRGGGGGGGGKKDKLREVLDGDLRALDDDDDMNEAAAEKEKEKNSSSTTTPSFVEGSLECIAMVDETTFITGGDSGSISLWSTIRKKPIFTQPLAHGLTVSTPTSPDVPPVHKPRWITALACLPYSDLFASGSYDGHVRLWKIDSKLKSFSSLGNIRIPGIINSLQLLQPPKSFFTTTNTTTSTTTSTVVGTTTATTTNGSSEKTKTAPLPSSPWPPTLLTTTAEPGPIFVIAGTGQEHRFGRWLSIKKTTSQEEQDGEGEGAINATYVVALMPKSESRSQSRTLSR